MIEETPPLAFAEVIERPPAELVERLRGAPTSFVVDAMGGSGALDWRIRPIVGHALLGVALTCDCGANDNLALIAAAAECEPGDVLVAATGSACMAAVTGDLLLGVARNRGVVGFVTDGLVRDLADLEALGMPVYAMGLTPNSPARRGPGTVGLPIVCGGCAVASGDVIVGDRDGVVVVPRALLAETLVNLDRVKAAEAAMLARVRGGRASFPSAPLHSARRARPDRSAPSGASPHDRFSHHRLPHPSARPEAVRLRLGERRAGAETRLDAGRPRRRRQALRDRRLRLRRGRRRHAAISRRGGLGRDSLAKRDRRVLGAVACLPLERGEAIEPEIERVAKLPVVRGVRRLIQNQPDPEFVLKPGVPRGAAAPAALQSLVRHLHSPSAAAEHAEDDRAAVPEVAFVLDHIGKPGIKAGLIDPWRQQIREMAALPNVVCKLSGVTTEADPRAGAGMQLRPYIDHVIECFGPDRILYGGDWPVSRTCRQLPAMAGDARLGDRRIPARRQAQAVPRQRGQALSAEP